MQYDRHKLTEAFNLSVREVNELHAAGLPRAQDNGSGTAIYNAHDVLSWAITHRGTKDKPGIGRKLLDPVGLCEVITPPPGDANRIIQDIYNGILPSDASALEIQAYSRAAQIFAEAQKTEQQRAKTAGELIDRQRMIETLESMYASASNSINDYLFERLNRVAKESFDIDDDTNFDVLMAARRELIPILESMASILDTARGL